MLLLAAGTAGGATVAGIVKISFDLRLGFANLTATEEGNPTNVVSTVTDRRGSFTMAVGVGNWSIALDTEELAEWGYQALSVPLTVPGTAPVWLELIPDPVEPPVAPFVILTGVSEDRFNLLIEGGGGRLFRVEWSPDLTAWSRIASFPTAKGFVNVSSDITWPDPPPALWRVVVVE